MRAHQTPLRVLVTATGTEVGKTWVTRQLVAGLRDLDRRVWIWKPVACGDWQDACAADSRALAPLLGDGQDPASLCQHQWPEPASPHRAAAAAGDALRHATLIQEGQQLSQGTHDLVVEGAGGLLSPLSSERSTAADLARDLGLHLLIVTNPDLGTFHHTQAVVSVARQFGLPILGLVVNHVRPISVDVATAEVAEELAEWCQVPLLAEFQHGDDSQQRNNSQHLPAAQPSSAQGPLLAEHLLAIHTGGTEFTACE